MPRRAIFRYLGASSSASLKIHCFDPVKHSFDINIDQSCHLSISPKFYVGKKILALIEGLFTPAVVLYLSNEILMILLTSKIAVTLNYC